MKSTFAIAALVGAAAAAPHNKNPPPSPYSCPSSTPTHTSTASAKPTASMGPTDIQILNYALTLEHLEDKFYREGLANYSQAAFASSGFDGSFYENLKRTSFDESTHVSFLTSAIQAAGGKAVAECTYNFPAHDPKSFVQLASVLEGVGVSAYLGAAAFIMSKNYLTAAGSILTTEARHSSFLRNSLGEAPYATPFDTPLDFDEVYTLAAPFIVSCPSSNPALPVKAFPALTLTTMGMPKAGDTITFKSASNLKDKTVYAAFITVTGPIFEAAMVSPDGMSFSTKIPNGVAGQSYVVLTNCKDEVTDDTVVAGPGLVEIVPPTL